MLNCELAHAMPVVRAFSMAISAARFMTRCPMPLSPCSKAVLTCSRTTRMSGRTLNLSWAFVSLKSLPSKSTTSPLNSALVMLTVSFAMLLAINGLGAWARRRAGHA